MWKYFPAIIASDTQPVTMRNYMPLLSWRPVSRNQGKVARRLRPASAQGKRNRGARKEPYSPPLLNSRAQLALRGSDVCQDLWLWEHGLGSGGHGPEAPCHDLCQNHLIRAIRRLTGLIVCDAWRFFDFQAGNFVHWALQSLGTGGAAFIKMLLRSTE